MTPVPARSARRWPAALGAAPAVLAACLLALPAGAAAPGLPPTLARFLRAEGFTPADLAAIAAGRAVARPLPRAERDEAGAIGVVRIAQPPDRFLERFRDIVRFERTDTTIVGRFGTPAGVADLEGYAVPDTDVDDLADCVLGDCDVNLSAEAIGRLRRIDSRGAEGRARLDRAVREMLAGYVADYQRRGNAALIVYRDHAAPVALADSSARLLRQSSELAHAAPAIADYFRAYPQATLPPGGEEFFYWSVMSFGMKPITRANHVVIVPATTDGLAGFVAASRTIYASHYFRDGLEVKYVVPVSAERTAFYLVSVNRSHSESLTGVKGLLLGSKIRSSARSGVERHIQHVKRQAERAAP